MLKRRLDILSLAAFLLLIMGSQAARATTAIIPRDDEMVVESRAIVTGRVTGISTAADPGTEYVYTYIRLAVSSVLKGEITEREIVLKELGGETPERGTQIFGMPRFEFGQNVLLYLNTWPDGALRVHQGFLGKFNISRDPSTGREFVERQVEGDVAILGSASAGTNHSELEAYTEMVGDLIETNRNRMTKFERRYFEGVPMLAHPNEFSPAPNGSEVTPQWTLLSPTSPARWFEADNNQPIVFYVNPAGAPGFMQVQEDMQAAMNAWSNAGGSIRITYGGATAGCGVQTADGLNTISFNNCDGYFAPSSGCAGVLAVSGIVRYIPSQTKVVGGITYGKAIESNMSFNPAAFCNFANRCQIQEVATHEMGHAIGLGHATDSTATMAAYAHFDNRCAWLSPDDINGLTSIYPGGPGSGRLTVTSTSLPEASQDHDYSVTLTATGGSGGYQWDLASGSLPFGIRLGSSGLVFGRTTNTGTFSFVARVRDSSGATSQNALSLVVTRSGASVQISSIEFRKKKLFVTGTGFVEGAMVYSDGEGLTATLDGSMLITQKRKQKAGTHQVFVMNPDGTRSNTMQLVIE